MAIAPPPQFTGNPRMWAASPLRKASPVMASAICPWGTAKQCPGTHRGRLGQETVQNPAPVCRAVASAKTRGGGAVQNRPNPPAHDAGRIRRPGPDRHESGDRVCSCDLRHLHLADSRGDEGFEWRRSLRHMFGAFLAGIPAFGEFQRGSLKRFRVRHLSMGPCLPAVRSRPLRARCRDRPRDRVAPTALHLAARHPRTCARKLDAKESPPSCGRASRVLPISSSAF